MLIEDLLKFALSRKLRCAPHGLKITLDQIPHLCELSIVGYTQKTSQGEGNFGAEGIQACDDGLKIAT